MRKFYINKEVLYMLNYKALLYYKIQVHFCSKSEDGTFFGTLTNIDSLTVQMACVRMLPHMGDKSNSQIQPVETYIRSRHIVVYSQAWFCWSEVGNHATCHDEIFTWCKKERMIQALKRKMRMLKIIVWWLIFSVGRSNILQLTVYFFIVKIHFEQ